MVEPISDRLQEFLGASSAAMDDVSLRAECGQFVRGLQLNPQQRGLLLVQIMETYVNHCGWTPKGAKLWQLMEYVVRRGGLEFQRESMITCVSLLPQFAGCNFPSETLASLIAKSLARLGYWPALTPALEGMHEMRR